MVSNGMIGKAGQLATQPMCMVVHISSGVASRRRILQKTVASTRPHGLRRVDIALIFQGSSQLFQLMLTDHLGMYVEIHVSDDQ